MTSLGFTVKKNLASTIKDYLKSKGRNVSEEDIDKILQRLVDVNSKRPPKESIFNGGHKYFGGNGKDFIVSKEQQINLSVQEYNKIFEGYLEKEEESTNTQHLETAPEEVSLTKEQPTQQEEIKLSDEALKSIKNQAFKTSLSNMSDRQLTQFANSANLTTDINQLEMIALEFETRGDKEGAKAIMKTIQAIKGEEQTFPAKDQAKVIETPAAADINNAQETELSEDNSEQINQNEIKINPSDEEIQKNINNLELGESYTYLEVKEQDSWGFGKNQKPITWTRNEDHTLTKMEPDFKIDGDFGALTEIYTADGMQLLSRTQLGSGNLTKGLYTTTKFTNSKPTTEITDLKDLYLQNDNNGRLPNAVRILRLMSPEVNVYKNDVFKNNAIAKDKQTFTLKELKNLKDETILSYKEGKFFDSNNKEIDHNQATKIIEELLEKQDLSELVKNYNT